MLTPPRSSRPAPRITALASLGVLVASLSYANSVFAQEPTGDEQGARWSVGVGVLSMQKPYAGMGRDNIALPVVQFENKYINLFGPQLEVKLPRWTIGESQQIETKWVVKWDGSGYDSSDAKILKGMHDRGGSFWTGPKVEWKTGVVDVSAQWLADVSGKSNGREANLSLERTWFIGERLMLTPHIGATLHDKKFVNYYFGVRPDEALPGRPVYEGKSVTRGEVGVRGIYLFNERHAVLVDVVATSVGNSVKRSPLVDRSSENRVIMAYTYRIR
ncbi:MAG: Outer membrane protein OmpV [Luteibacter sp.]|uniref:MipA/OmpV family protein n=1 Tax=Luteibacter sp. TaxID=1886636 RepID=UPI001382C703|nr:MipA/OmpV family protein [Luteibacter sp.]KAF1008928.1 MAG: Outer membrane protein OmpV [Luteibacter sp.]